MLILHALFLTHLFCNSLMKLAAGTVQGADWRDKCHPPPHKEAGSGAAVGCG